MRAIAERHNFDAGRQLEGNATFFERGATLGHAGGLRRDQLAGPAGARQVSERRR